MVILSDFPFPFRTEDSLVFQLIFLPRMSTRALPLSRQPLGSSRDEK